LHLLFLQIFLRIFCGFTTKKRAIRGSAIAPAPAQSAVSASRPSYPLRPKGFSALRAASTSSTKVNAGALAGGRHRAQRISPSRAVIPTMRRPPGAPWTALQPHALIRHGRRIRARARDRSGNPGANRGAVCEELERIARFFAEQKMRPLRLLSGTVTFAGGQRTRLRGGGVTL
jgi:hypothetical protein